MRIGVIGLRSRDEQHIRSKFPKSIDIRFCEANDVREAKAMLNSDLDKVYHNYRFSSHSTGWAANSSKNVTNYKGGIATLVALIKSDLEEGH